MPYQKKVENFNKTFNLQLDATSIGAAIGSILTAFPKNSSREAQIKEYITSNFLEFAAEHEQARQVASIESTGHSVPTDAKELLTAYIGLIGEIVQDVSGLKAEEMKQAQIDAKAEAKKARDLAEKAQLEANEAREKRSYDAKRKIEEANNLVKRANLRMERANDDASFSYLPWAPTMNHFGLTTEEAKNLLNEQVKDVKYSEIRREQMRRLGVKNPLFMAGLNALQGVKYENATPEAKENMNNVYVTRELMQARLNRHNFLWKLIFRGQTKAMQNYVKAADEALKLAGFPEEQKAVAMQNAENGIRSEGDEIKGAFGEENGIFKDNDKKVADRARRKLEKEQKQNEEREREERQKEEQKLNEQKLQQEKEEQIKASADSFFEIGFRPTLDPEGSKEQAKLIGQIGLTYIQNQKDLPEGLKTVFNTNYKKVRAVREFVKNDLGKIKDDKDAIKAKHDALLESFAKADESVKLELAEANIEYKPITYDQLKLQHQLKHELETGKKGKIAPGVEEKKALEKQEISKKV